MEATFQLGTQLPLARRASFRVALVASLLVALVSLAGVPALGGPAVAMAQGTGSITGKVTDASTTLAVAGIEVCAFPTNEFTGRCETTNLSGDYTISGLTGGEYTVRFSVPEGSSLNYLTKYYENGTPVSVIEGSTTPGIDAALQAGGQITGLVTDASTTAAVAGIEVCALVGEVIEEVTERCATTDSSGKYTITSLKSDNYTVAFSSSTGTYLTQYYNGKADSSEAELLPVAAGETRAGINAALQPVEVPTVVTEAASAVTESGATLNATVNPNGGEVSECQFEYGTTTAAYEHTAPCTPVPGSGTSPVAVSASIVALTGNTLYHFRISATNTRGKSEGADETFKTLAGAEPTTTSTSLSGGGQSGTTITVPEGTAVTDQATLSGTNVATATGTVAYKVYSDNKCETEVASAGSVSVNGELVPVSNPETLAAGTYFWQASYAGDSNNGESKSACGSEVETVTTKQHEEKEASEKKRDEEVAAAKKKLDEEAAVAFKYLKEEATTKKPQEAADKRQGEQAVAAFSSTQLAGLLASRLIPSGKGAKIAALLKAGGFTFLFKALEAGTAAVGWYQVPRGAGLARNTKAKPILVASGKLTFTAAGTAKMKVALTAAGKYVLKHAKRLKLTAKGTFTPTGRTPITARRTFVLKR